MEQAASGYVDRQGKFVWRTELFDQADKSFCKVGDGVMAAQIRPPAYRGGRAGPDQRAPISGESGTARSSST
jgi:hypothetical protein